MTFWESITTCFSKYMDSSGRASRSEYWWFFLFQGLVVAAAAALTIGFDAMGHFTLGGVLGLLLWAPVVPAATAVMKRRLHDTGRSGWFITLSATLEPGVPWPNEYGPPPGEQAAAGCRAPSLPSPGGPTKPAVFIACPTCRKVVNQELAHCPFCLTALSAAPRLPH